MLTIILVSAVLIFSFAYVFYGNFLIKKFSINDQCPTPSHTEYDGIDRVPAKKAVLLGHHFSSIAGAGPIVGPIIAALAFGWLPTLIWVLIGSIFIGGVHDFSSLVASIRHKARSIAEIAKEYMSNYSFKLFLVFIWLALIYVLVVFTDLTATTFVQDGGVATSAFIFILLAIAFGFTVYRLKFPLWKASLVFVPLIFAAIYFGESFPAALSDINFSGLPAVKFWSFILLIYCAVAAITPVWVLLQPRDYLSSYLLYTSVFGGFIGILLGGFKLQYPAFNAWSVPQLGTLFPILFISVACGACSGFHSIVASGTSSKQIDKESDARTIGYGAMLIEGVVAVIAIITVAMLAKSDSLTTQQPLAVYGSGIAKFLSILGIPENIGYTFGLLALSTFLLTTLDTVTRLGRYIFEEFFDLKGKNIRFFSTFATLVLPAIFILIDIRDVNGNVIPAWKAIWPVFGATNQLLAGLALLVVTVWLKKIGKKILFVLLPMLFMVSMTLWALVLLINQYGFSTIGFISCFLLILAILVIIEAGRVLMKFEKDKDSIEFSQI